MSAGRELEPPEDLTIPRPGSTTAQVVLSAALRRLLGDLGAALSPRSGIVELGQAAAARALRASLAAHPGAVASVLRRADVGAWIRCLRPGCGGVDREATLQALLAGLTLGLASAGALTGPIRLPTPPRAVSSLAGRAWIEAPEGAGAWTIDNERISFERGEAVALESVCGREDRFVTLVGDLALVLVDSNPLALVEAHPEKSGNAVDLGGQPVAAWVASVREALGWIEAVMPALHRELLLFIQAVVPVGFFAEQHLSASYQEAIGTIYLSLHPQPLTMVEALIHELSHNKLNALLEVDAVLANGASAGHRSPVRADPRPLYGVLLAVHAFSAVAGFYEALVAKDGPEGRDPAIRRRMTAVVESNHAGLAVLRAQARPTRIGAGLMAELETIDQRQRALVSAW